MRGLEVNPQLMRSETKKGERQMNKFKIVDWMNNRLFPNKVFKTFEDGWDFIYKKFPNEEDLSDYFVVDINQKERGKSIIRDIN